MIFEKVYSIILEILNLFVLGFNNDFPIVTQSQSKCKFLVNAQSISYYFTSDYLLLQCM